MFIDNEGRPERVELQWSSLDKLKDKTNWAVLAFGWYRLRKDSSRKWEYDKP